MCTTLIANKAAKQRAYTLEVQPISVSLNASFGAKPKKKTDEVLHEQF
ncbi:hypothetical protein L917_21040 [Phytophthora nicotianae]|uniref:Uncharacterized protein n=1 Tax=Phytophthora nicotianae TaxID=4792 RepID=W2K112_PHYNI|nr:hypothetical protein L917_21040 [Phytophthora nicotianae]